jgi:hypothetical protein
MHRKAGSPIDFAALESCVVAVKAATYRIANARSPTANATPTNNHTKTQLTSHLLHSNSTDARFSTPDALAPFSATREVGNHSNACSICIVAHCSNETTAFNPHLIQFSQVQIGHLDRRRSPYDIQIHM